jgi:TM2 domain-containing membrane protein YozV
MSSLLDKQEKRDRTAIYLSALIFPGVGQFVQGRVLMGVLYAAGFTVCVIMFAADAVRIITSFYRLGFEFNTYNVPHLPIIGMLTSFACGILVYTANVLDAFLAAKRRPPRPSTT